MKKLKFEKEHGTLHPSWWLFSILIHLMVVYFALLRSSISPEQPDVEVKLVAQAPERDPIRKQIVDFPELAPRIKPDKAQYLSEHDQRVEKETQKPRENPHPWQEAVVQGSSADAKKQPSKKKEASENVLDGMGVPKASSASQLPARPETDFLPNVNLGDKTYLNAEAFKHTGYYLEIKRKIEIAWNPHSVLQRVLRGGFSIQAGMLATYVGVTLNGDGTLSDLVILRPSGVKPLDDEALRTFRVSAPFTRVPDELLTEDGKLRFEFGFIVSG